MADMSIDGGKLSLPPNLNSFDKIADALTPTFHQISFLLQNRMASYPPPKPTSDRSGKLGQRWTPKVNRSASMLEAIVGNNLGYAPWVQSARFQARWHRGWWQTDEVVIRRSAPDIINLVTNKINSLSASR